MKRVYFKQRTLSLCAVICLLFDPSSYGMEEPDHLNIGRQHYIKGVEYREYNKFNDAIKEWTIAAEEGKHPKACYELAKLYFEGEKDVIVSEEKGIQYFELAKTYGYPLKEKDPLIDIYNQARENWSSWRKPVRCIGEVSKKVSVYSYYISQSACLTAELCRLTGWQDLAQTIEKASIIGKAISGSTKVIYGITDILLTGGKRKALVSLGGLCEIAAIHLQWQQIKQCSELKKERDKLNSLRKEYEGNNDPQLKQAWQEAEKDVELKDRQRVINHEWYEFTSFLSNVCVNNQDKWLYGGYVTGCVFRLHQRNPKNFQIMKEKVADMANNIGKVVQEKVVPCLLSYIEAIAYKIVQNFIDEQLVNNNQLVSN